MWDRSRFFLRRAGTVILGINILLWFLATYPRSATLARQYEAQRTQLVARLFPALAPGELPNKAEELRDYRLLDTNAVADMPAGYRAAAPASAPEKPQPGGYVTWSPEQVSAFEDLQILNKTEAGENLRQSFAGRAGRAIEPAIAPLGFDWKMGIGIVSSFAAREVFVSTMSTVYNVGEGEGAGHTHELENALRSQKHPGTGTPVYTPLLAVTLMVFYVFALQCVSTVAVVRRETNSWKWPLFQWVYMGALAWGFAFITWHAGHLLGWG